MMCDNSQEYSTIPSNDSNQPESELSCESSHRNYKNGRWSEEEHRRFLEGILEYGNEWKKVQKLIGTRSSTQARSHAQKFFLRIKKKAIVSHTNSTKGNEAKDNVIISNFFELLTSQGKDFSKTSRLTLIQREKLMVIVKKFSNRFDLPAKKYKLKPRLLSKLPKSNANGFGKSCDSKEKIATNETYSDIVASSEEENEKPTCIFSIQKEIRHKYAQYFTKPNVHRDALLGKKLQISQSPSSAIYNEMKCLFERKESKRPPGSDDSTPKPIVDKAFVQNFLTDKNYFIQPHILDSGSPIKEGPRDPFAINFDQGDYESGHVGRYTGNVDYDYNDDMKIGGDEDFDLISPCPMY